MSFSLLTLIIAVVGAATGVASFLWNIIEYASSGSKVRVRKDFVYTRNEHVFDYRYPSGEPKLEIKAVNKRRGSVEVRSFGVIYYGESTGSRGYKLSFRGTYDDSDSTPISLQGKHGARFLLPLEQFPDHIREEIERKPTHMRCFVELGDGKIVKTARFTLGTGPDTGSTDRPSEPLLPSRLRLGPMWLLPFAAAG